MSLKRFSFTSCHIGQIFFVSLPLPLQRDAKGRLVKVKLQLRTGDRERTSQIHKSYQEQILQAAMVSLKNDPISVRDMTSMTMAIDPDRLPIAKKMIEAFTEHLCQYLEGGTRKKVYQLGVALYPLQKA